MKKITKLIMAMALGGAVSASFAQSASSGIDPVGQGTLTINATIVGSCSAPTVSVNLGSIDFHVAKNGATGVYEHPVDLAVTCSNPNQHWNIFSNVRSFELASGVTGGTPETAYVSVSSNAAVPGNPFNTDADPSAFGLTGAFDDLTPTEQQFIFDQGFMAGVGNQTITSKLTFGKALASGLVADQFPMQGGVPTGTIDGRGAFAVDIPLMILY